MAAARAGRAAARNPFRARQPSWPDDPLRAPALSAPGAPVPQPNSNTGPPAACAKIGRRASVKLADKIVMRPVDALIPYASNARTHSDAQIAQIAASIAHRARGNAPWLGIGRKLPANQWLAAATRAKLHEAEEYRFQVADRADGDWKGEALQQREVDVDVEPLRLETGEAAGDGLEPLADHRDGPIERATANLSRSRKPIPRSRSVGRAAIASRDRRSFTRMRTPAGSPPSSVTRPTSSRSTPKIDSWLRWSPAPRKRRWRRSGA